MASSAEHSGLAVGCLAVLGGPRLACWPAGWPPAQPALLTDPCLLPARSPVAQMDAAASLLLLSILILLSKERNAQLRLGHPLVAAVAACLCLPLLALLPGSFRAW